LYHSHLAEQCPQRAPFQFETDRGFFTQFLCREGETLDNYAELFDFDARAIKRAAFAKIRDDILRQRLAEHGDVCQLRIHAQCDVSTGLHIDHAIPLSTNQLNKRLRGLGTHQTPDGKRRKTPTQSFGSNHPRNLILACAKCNGHKKHRILDAATIRRALSL
jgi:5-methylcytosine-specific restriction endonuclease McrA